MLLIVFISTTMLALGYTANNYYTNQENLEQLQNQQQQVIENLDNHGEKLELIEDRNEQTNRFINTLKNSNEKQVTGRNSHWNVGSVNTTGSFQISGVDIEVVEEITDRDGVVGLAWIDQGRIKLESNRNTKDFYGTCVHEVLHIESGYRHEFSSEAANSRYRYDEWIHRAQDQLVEPVCLELLYQLESK